MLWHYPRCVGMWMYLHINNWKILSINIGGSRRGVPGARPPQRVQILSFWHRKFSKSNRLGSPRPYEVHAPLLEILDPPLIKSQKYAKTDSFIQPSQTALATHHLEKPWLLNMTECSYLFHCNFFIVNKCSATQNPFFHLSFIL